MTSSLEEEGGVCQKMTNDDMMTLTILGNLIIVVILIFIFIFFKVEQSKYLDIADIYWV